MIDLHSHILPGIDDGPERWQDSVEIARGLSKMGFSHIFATPHFIIGQYDSGATYIKGQIDKFQTQIDAEGIKLKILPGNEVYFDSALTANDKQSDFLLLGESQSILLEAPFGRFDINLLYKIIFTLQNMGIKVILAHPERAAELLNDFGLVKDLADRDVKFQLNITSLLGKYGTKSQKTGEKLIEEKLVYAIGTDIHRLEHLHTTINSAITNFVKIIGKQKLNEMNKALSRDLGLN